MNIGLALSNLSASAHHIAADAQSAATGGIPTYWVGEIFDGYDALTAITATGLQVPDLRFATSVVPIYPRHPVMLAGQALTVQSAIGNRLTLGIGVSHKSLVEGVHGLSFERPARYMREYASVLAPLLRGESVSFHGEFFTVESGMNVPGATPPPLLISAHGPAMLAVAGELADGAIVLWAGPNAIANHIAPPLLKAASGRPDPRIALGVLMSVTNDPEGTRETVNRDWSAATSQPSYSNTLAMEGASGPGDVVIAGDESAIERQLNRLIDTGVTEFFTFPFGSDEEQARTTALISSLAAR
jgi:F420-dependent oxidoreductase-like protein